MEELSNRAERTLDRAMEIGEIRLLEAAPYRERSGFAVNKPRPAVNRFAFRFTLRSSLAVKT